MLDIYLFSMFFVPSGAEMSEISKFYTFKLIATVSQMLKNPIHDAHPVQRLCALNSMLHACY